MSCMMGSPQMSEWDYDIKHGRGARPSTSTGTLVMNVNDIASEVNTGNEFRQIYGSPGTSDMSYSYRDRNDRRRRDTQTFQRI